MGTGDLTRKLAEICARSEGTVGVAVKHLERGDSVRVLVRDPAAAP